MSWIKDTDGDLVNLDYVSIITVTPDHEVKAWIADETAEFSLLHVAETEKEARERLEQIWEQINRPKFILQKKKGN